MEFSADIQFCRDNKNGVIPKEVCIVSLKGNSIGHFLISPPYNANRLSEKIKKTNNYITKNIHSISWFDGYMSKKNLCDNLREISKQASKIFVRGQDKALFLESIMTCQIINLEKNSECPPFQNLPLTDYYCTFHSLKFCYLSYNCALNNAVKLKNWVTTQESYIHEQQKSLEQEKFLFDLSTQNDDLGDL